MVFQDIYCDKCNEEYANINYEWCKPCQINYLKKNFTNWTSGNEKVNGLIQEMQLKIEEHSDIIVEWIPYNQFGNIKEIKKDAFSTLYLAIWRDGPLSYCLHKNEYERKTKHKKVALNYLHNSQNITNELLNSKV